MKERIFPHEVHSSRGQFCLIDALTHFDPNYARHVE